MTPEERQRYIVRLQLLGFDYRVSDYERFFYGSLHVASSLKVRWRKDEPDTWAVGQKVWNRLEKQTDLGYAEVVPFMGMYNLLCLYAESYQQE